MKGARDPGFARMFEACYRRVSYTIIEIRNSLKM